MSQITTRQKTAAAIAAVAALVVAGGVQLFSVSNPISLVNETWVCDGFQDHTQIQVHNDDPTKAIGGQLAGARVGYLGKDCSGTIDVDIFNSVGDGFKVGGGTHDLTVTGKITCRGRVDGVHQDGIQVLNGERVTFKDMVIDCPTSNNGALWIESNGHGGPESSWPHSVVCDGCTLRGGNASLNLGMHTVSSGARNSTLYRGTSQVAPKNCIRFREGAIQPVLENNQCLDAAKWPGKG